MATDHKRDDTEKTPSIYRDCDALVDDIIAQLGQTIVVGLPLGLGKANHLINALYQRAERDPNLSLTIFTALTLQAPVAGSELERRFLEPVAARLFDDYPPLDYARALRDGSLPDNVQVTDFFLQPGAWLGVPEAQQAYTSINYTHALDTLLRAGINVLLQLVAPADSGKSGYSLSCNPDITADLLNLRRAGQVQFLSVGQVNSRLPFLGGAAARPADDFDYLLQDPTYEFALYTPPHKPVNATDHAIGLHAASQIPDGGTLQIGIGSIGDAIAHALILRHRHNPQFNSLLNSLHGNSVPGNSPHSPHQEDCALPPTMERDSFNEGLYGLTEMLVEGFLALIQAGVIKREVDGALVHSGFFIGSPVFYQLLSQLTAEQRQKIAMMPVSFINELYGSGPSVNQIPGPYGESGTEQGKRNARTGARFINSAMMVTLTGAIVSDGLENAQVVSGVGGQYNFIAQSFALTGARSIITLPATRTKAGRVRSNIVWQYAHTTIPRHLRDIVITEYGVADLRDKNDRDIIIEMLKVTDSRFQAHLLAQAKKAGKIPRDYTIPNAYRHNTPERIRRALADAGKYLPSFPLGSGLTAEEEQLAKALSQLAPQIGNHRALISLIWQGLKRPPTPRQNQCLARMQLQKPKGIRERIYRALLLATLEV